MIITEKLTKEAVLVPASTTKELADNLYAAANYRLNQNKQLTADVFTAKHYVALISKDSGKEIREIKDSFAKAFIENGNIIPQKGTPFPTLERHYGLDMIQILMLAKSHLSNCFDKKARQSVIIMFPEEKMLRRALLRLIHTGSDNRTSWLKTSFNKITRYLLRVEDIPLYELLRLQDENEHLMSLIFRGVPVPGQKGAGTAFFYVPWGYTYPALEKLLPRIVKQTDLLADDHMCISLPDKEQFTRLYDPHQLIPHMPHRQTEVIKSASWKPLKITISLRKTDTSKGENRSKAALWLLDIPRNLDRIKKQLYRFTEADLLNLEAAVFKAGDNETLAVLCRKNSERYRAFFSNREETFQEKWRQEEQNTTLFLPRGYDFFPSLQRKTYLEALGITNIDNETVILRKENEGIHLLHLPHHMFQPLRSKVVQYEATVLHKPEIEKIIESSLLDFTPLEEVPAAGAQEQEIEQTVKVEDRDFAPPKDDFGQYRENDPTPAPNENQGPETGRGKTVFTDQDRENRAPFSGQPFQNYALKQEEKQLVQKARVAMLNQVKKNYSAILLEKEWQRLFGLAYNLRQQVMLSIPPDQASLLFAGGKQLKKDGKKKKDIERALLLSVVPKSKRSAPEAPIDRLLSQKTAPYKKLLVALYQLYESPWQRIINEILNDYEHSPWELWKELFMLNKEHTFLDQKQEEEEALAVKLVFDTSPEIACAFLKSLSEDKFFPGPLTNENLGSFLLTENNALSLTKRILALFYAVFTETLGATEQLTKKITDLDRQVENSPDLRLQWLYASCLYRFNRDESKRTLVRERILRMIRDGQADCLLLPLVSQMISQKCRGSQLALREKSPGFFEGQDEILALWFKLLEAWQRITLNDVHALGKATDCGLEPDCRQCSPDTPGRDGFFCSMKRQLNGVDSGAEKSLRAVNTFIAFLNIIEQKVNKKKDATDHEDPQIKQLREFLSAPDKKPGPGPSEQGIKGPFAKMIRNEKAEDNLELLTMLLDAKPSEDTVKQKALSCFGEDPEILGYLSDMIKLSQLDRLTEFLKGIDEWRKEGRQEAIDKLLAKAYKLGPKTNDFIKGGKIDFFLAFISALVSVGRIEEALKQAGTFLKKQMAMPVPKQCLWIVELCHILARLTSIEKVYYQRKIKDIFHKAKFFKVADLDLSLCDRAKMELLKALLGTFNFRSQDEKDARERIITIERYGLLKRMREDCKNGTP